MTRLADSLYDLALEHAGVFTSGEASAASIAPATVVMAAKRGLITPLSRGIYRLVAFPIDEEIAQLWEAVLWPTIRRDPILDFGYLSHLTALRLHHRALEYTPPQISISVPRKMRLRRTPPRWLQVHSADLPPTDVMKVDSGLPVTTLKRTIEDCVAANVGRRFIVDRKSVV